MKEIGGYLELEHFCGEEYHCDKLRFNTVRSSIEFVIKERRYEKVWLPFYLCNSVCDMLRKAHINYQHYYIDSNLLPILQTPIKNSEVVLIVNYFGIIDEQILDELRKKYINIIVDNTHAFFQTAVNGIDTVYTCRKFFGVSDGAYLKTDLETTNYNELPKDCSGKRMGHLLGRFENPASEYYGEFCENDDSLANQEIKKMSSLTQNILCGIDYQFVKNRREKNYKILNEYLSDSNQLKTKCTGLYMYPFLHSNGATIKRELISKKIYVPTLWPNVFDTCVKDSWEYYLAENMVLLPIDQRYGEEEMNYVLENIVPYLNT